MTHQIPISHRKNNIKTQFTVNGEYHLQMLFFMKVKITLLLLMYQGSLMILKYI
jgi:hypothetical protein